MHARFTRRIATMVLGGALGFVSVLSPATRAGMGDREQSQETALSILPAQSTLIGRRATAQLIATGRGAGRLDSRSDARGRVGELEPAGRVGHPQGAGRPQGRRNGNHRRPAG